MGDIPNFGYLPTPSWCGEHPAYYERDVEDDFDLTEPNDNLIAECNIALDQREEE